MVELTFVTPPPDTSLLLSKVGYVKKTLCYIPHFGAILAAFHLDLRIRLFNRCWSFLGSKVVEEKPCEVARAVLNGLLRTGLVSFASFIAHRGRTWLYDKQNYVNTVKN